MKVYEYEGGYEEYKKTQEAANRKKLDKVWANEGNIKLLSSYLLSNVKDIKFGICHGVRNGTEIRWFKKHLKEKENLKVIGTEISSTATSFEDVIEWDFHDIKDEWINNVDFIYSNSFDHTIKPQLCLDNWLSCLSENGLCILEWTNGHAEKWTTAMDPFGASLQEYQDLINDKYEVKDLIQGVDYKPRETTYVIIGAK